MVFFLFCFFICCFIQHEGSPVLPGQLHAATLSPALLSFVIFFNFYYGFFYFQSQSSRLYTRVLVVVRANTIIRKTFERTQWMHTQTMEPKEQKIRSLMHAFARYAHTMKARCIPFPIAQLSSILASTYIPEFVRPRELLISRPGKMCAHVGTPMHARIFTEAVIAMSFCAQITSQHAHHVDKKVSPFANSQIAQSRFTSNVRVGVQSNDAPAYVCGWRMSSKIQQLSSLNTIISYCNPRD